MTEGRREEEERYPLGCLLAVTVGFFVLACLLVWGIYVVVERTN